MIQIRKSKDRGYAQQGWLESYHSFSFANYYDANHMGFGPLRVINEDWIQPKNGFETHGHRDMEIITYMLGGELSHKDNLGGGSTISPNQIQCMSAGTGIRHSEMNEHQTEIAHLLQIWIKPSTIGLKPNYKDYDLNVDSISGQLGLIVTGDKEEANKKNIAFIHQDIKMYVGRLRQQNISHTLNSGRKGYLHLVSGAMSACNFPLQAGDAVMISDEYELNMNVSEQVELLFFDLPAS
jgi:redox-sensitive bicupin YhaK (pirin superfamily)